MEAALYRPLLPWHPEPAVGGTPRLGRIRNVHRRIGKFIARQQLFLSTVGRTHLHHVGSSNYLAFPGSSDEPQDREEYLVNAVHDLEEAVINGLPPEERDRASRYLGSHRCEGRPNIGIGGTHWARERLAADRWIAAPHSPVRRRRLRGCARSIESIWRAHHAFRSAARGQRGDGRGNCRGTLVGGNRRGSLRPTGGTIGILAISDLLLIGSTLVPSIFVGIAVFALRRSRMTALHFFHRAVLLSICFTEVFMFYRNQAAALVVLAFNLFSWACVNVVISQESRAGSLNR